MILPEVKVQGTGVFYRQRGKGRPLMLVHGWNASSAMWMLNLGELSSCRRVIAPDLPGHGSSGAPDGFGFDLAGFSGFLEGLRRSLFLHDLDLVGHSMGGCICLEYALRFPQRVRRLVLLGTPWRRAALSWTARLPAPACSIRLFYRLRGPRLNRFMFTRALRHPETVPEEVLQENLRQAGTITPRAFVSTTRMMRNVGFDESQLAELDVPVLLLWGEKDPIVSPEEGRRLKGVLPRANLLFVPDAAHSPQLDSPALFNRMVLEFLEG